MDEDELVSNGKFGMSIPHLQMSLPVVYPINAVSYDAAAVAAKKGKQNMERAQREAEEAKLAPKRMNYAERKAMQQEIMDAMVEEDFRSVREPPTPTPHAHKHPTHHTPTP